MYFSPSCIVAGADTGHSNQTADSFKSLTWVGFTTSAVKWPLQANFQGSFEAYVGLWDPQTLWIGKVVNCVSRKNSLIFLPHVWCSIRIVLRRSGKVAGDHALCFRIHHARSGQLGAPRGGLGFT